MVEISSEKFIFLIDEILTQFRRDFVLGKKKKNSTGIPPEFD